MIRRSSTEFFEKPVLNHKIAPTPWNTYTVPGLPSGPIGNPGREALAAAFRPAMSDYLFFVSKNDGTHVFTTNVKDHNNAVNQWQRTRANREGKSWRDLKKRPRRNKLTITEQLS